jgi:transcription termination/antitermination protein NusG
MNVTISAALSLTDPTSDPRVTPYWYAVKTRSRHEKKVLGQLLGRGIETFLPLYDRWSHWKDRRKRVEFPLFPCYCFARFPLVDRLRVSTAFGVVGVIGMNGKPEPVEEHEIAGIRKLAESLLPYDPCPFLVEGTEVEVVRGPLAGVRGRLVRKDRATRLVLAVTLIRQAATVEIHPADVVPVA